MIIFGWSVLTHDLMDADATRGQVFVSDSRRLVYVPGAPGSGKTSLAVPLVTELGYALLTKDRIEETLHNAFGAPEPDRAWSRRLGAAMKLLWALAADAPAVVIEANFRPYSERERAKFVRPYRAASRGALRLPACTRRRALQRPRHSSGARRDRAPTGGHGRV